MKRIFENLSLVIICFFIITSNGYAKDLKQTNATRDFTIKIVVDLEVVEPVSQTNKQLAPIVYNGKNFIPIRCMAEYFGYKVSWNQEQRAIVLNESISSKGKMLHEIDGYGRCTSFYEIQVNTLKDIAIKVDGKYISKDESGNLLQIIVYDNDTYLEAKQFGDIIGKKVSWAKENNSVVFGVPIKPVVFKTEDLVKVNNINELVELLNKYPYDNSNCPKYRTVVSNNADVGKSVFEKSANWYGIEKNKASMYRGIPTYMNGFFNRDYRNIIEEDFKNKYMGYFSGWWYYKEQEFHQESFVDEWINDTKKYNIVQKSNFVTDNRLLYLENGSYVMRGRWQFKYENHENPENIKYEIENDTPIEVGQWYEVDMDVLLHSPMNNAPTKVTSNMHSIGLTYCFGVDICNYRYLSKFRKIREEDVITFHKYKEVINQIDTYDLYEIVKYGDWIYYYNGENNMVNKVKKDGSEIIQIGYVMTLTSRPYINNIYSYDNYLCLNVLENRDHRLLIIDLETGKEVRMKNTGFSLVGVGDHIYYYNMDKLYKMSLHDHKKTIVKNDFSIKWKFYVNSENIFYLKNSILYKMDLNGKNECTVAEDVQFFDGIVDGWIYYKNSDICTYKVDVDGNRLQKLR
ncbi:stalk domain-containing protein [Vallitalea guaymasensis]|uniref:stalk domain-containing protein n=1 Tax=Vallitalea guaymasensis TaxID=1185412 RepID=UPI00272CE620|nr:stalk domain-containing protein [Vallitalea guaymasensis]